MEKLNGKLKGSDILSMDQFDVKSIFKVFDATDSIREQLKKKPKLSLLSHVLGILLFYEPSSRTMTSFASAIKTLGGQTIEYSNPSQTSSAVKGETFSDSIKVFETYSDFLIIRHPEKGAALRAAEVRTKVPIINAGDGSNEHPSQALLDMYTIYKRFKKLKNLKLLMTGDLLYGRTVHSLLKGLSYFSGNTIYLLSPMKLRMPKEIIAAVKDRVKIHEIHSQDDIPDDCNVWYWTRVQKERFSNLSEYNKFKHSLVLTSQLLKRKGNDSLIIMHPLPRVGEIETAIDTDKRAIYLTDQIRNGFYVRMGLLSLLFKK